MEEVTLVYKCDKVKAFSFTQENPGRFSTEEFKEN